MFAFFRLWKSADMPHFSPRAVSFSVNTDSVIHCFRKSRKQTYFCAEATGGPTAPYSGDSGSEVLKGHIISLDGAP